MTIYTRDPIYLSSFLLSLNMKRLKRTMDYLMALPNPEDAASSINTEKR